MDTKNDCTYPTRPTELTEFNSIIDMLNNLKRESPEYGFILIPLDGNEWSIRKVKKEFLQPQKNIYTKESNDG
jgi:hypothetical protein